MNCSVENCKGKHHAKGLCNKHYMQMWQKRRKIKRSVDDLVRNQRNNKPSPSPWWKFW